jgi:L-seryl-tRNA(Ser) seleniumtransferase
MTRLRDLPSVDQLLKTPHVEHWVASYGRPLTVTAIRTTLEDIRSHYSQETKLPDQDGLLTRIELTLQSWTAPTLQPVINAAGVILHTNLGRAPLSLAAMQAVQNVALGYSTLEYDLEKGKRGSRLVHAEALLQRITGAEAALVVNNNAAAVLLVLTALARRRAVVIARTQLVEIGGGFRIPDVMKQSGARLVEIGATNRVHLSDYATALDETPALVLHAHRSNFRIVGFTSEPQLQEIAEVAHDANIPFVDDLGSGTLIDTARFGLGHEPMVQESLAAGADLVCFSGDKLLGGPQAGIIVGKEELVARLKKQPLARALRADKLCLSALAATLLHYMKDEAEREIPVWRMISTQPEALRLRAQAWAEALGVGVVISGESTIGGGCLPEEIQPTFLLSLPAKSPERLLGRLRNADPPIIARLENDCVVLDPRTVLPEQEQALLQGLKQALESNS